MLNMSKEFQLRIESAFGEENARRLSAGEPRLTKTMLWKAAGVTSGACTQWFTGDADMALETCFKAAPLLRVNPFWLYDGSQSRNEAVSNVSAVPDTAYPAVPLISWVQAGMWADIVDNYLPGSGEELRAAFASKPGMRSFALRVEGDSMVSHNHTSFPPGTILIVDPARSPAPGDYVIAKDVDTQQATFKRLMQDGGRWFLKPLNPVYPTIPIDDPAIRVVGVVIESQIVNKL